MLRGLPGVTALASSQGVSVLASEMAQFAIRIWVYEKTGSVTALGLVFACYITPFLFLSPFAGVMIDRYNRKLMMAMSDFGAVIGTVLLVTMSAAGMLEVWHLYLAAAIGGVFGCFQWPAYSASISLMVPKEQLGRANGMLSLLEAGPGVFAPLLAGALLPLIGLTGLLTLDLLTFVLALAALVIIVVPDPPRREPGRIEKVSVLSDAAYGFRYIFARPSLLGLQLVFFLCNLFAGVGQTLTTPMILARTGNDATLLGWVLTAGAVGGIVGGVLMTAWGGFKRRVHGVLLGWILSALTASVIMGLTRNVWVWMAAQFAAATLVPLVNGSNQAIWQSKVAPELQGRVFSARRLIAWLSNPITPVVTGLLADRWLEPGMRSDGALSGVFGGVFGVGPGAGMALAFVISGLIVAAVGVLAYSFKAVRNVEDLLPDHAVT